MIVVNLKKQMEKKDVSIEELAFQIRETEAVLNNIINGKNQSIRFNIIDKLCNFFECTPGDIIKKKREKKDPQLTNIDLQETINTFKRCLDESIYKMSSANLKIVTVNIIKSITEVIGNLNGSCKKSHVFYKDLYLCSYDKEKKRLYYSDCIDINDGVKRIEFDVAGDINLLESIISTLNKTYNSKFANEKCSVYFIHNIMQCIIYI